MDLAPTSGTGVSAAVGSTAPGSTLTAPRGQLKSSARPLRAATGSPLVIVRVTVASVAGATRAAKQFFRGNARERKRHDRSRCRPLSRTARLGCWHLWGGIDWDWQRDRETLVADDALDFALHIVRKLAGAELGEIDAIPGAEPTNLAFVVRTLRRVAAGLIDEAVPNVDVDYPRLLGPTAI